MVKYISRRIILGITATARQWRGGSVNHGADLEAVESESIPSPSRMRTLVVQPKVVMYLLTYLSFVWSR
jgi:hypothetical protein